MWYVFEYANNHNFVSNVVGECLSCEEFTDNDKIGLVGKILSLVSCKYDFKVVFEEEGDE